MFTPVSHKVACHHQIFSRGICPKYFMTLKTSLSTIDNIILFTKLSFEHHVQRLALVLDRLQSQNLHVHIEETLHLLLQRLITLVIPYPPKVLNRNYQKIMAILALAEPKNKKQLRSFLGFVNFYRQLWYHRSHIITPLTAITSEKSKWVWGPDQKEAFLQVRNTIARQVLLRYPDFTKPFDIFTDASEHQLGAVICQDKWPIAFYSRKLNSAQCNYTTMEKELLSIVETSQQYRHILLGSHCRFYCDHKNLGFYHFKSERVRRWRATLEEFDYSFIYHPGKHNTIADMLSRYPMTNVGTSDYEEITTLDDSAFPATNKNIKLSQDSIPDLQKKVNMSQHYTVIQRENESIICRKGKIVLDPKLFLDILAWYHINLNHPGQDRTYRTISSVFYTPNMEAQVRHYINNCQVCKQSKISTKKYGLLPEPDTTFEPWEVIQIDLFGPWSFNDVDGVTHQIQGLSIIDIATRWTGIVPIYVQTV